MLNVAGHKRVGVRVGQGDLGDSTDWDSHTLESLCAFSANAQALLTLHLDQLSANEGESVKDYAS